MGVLYKAADLRLGRTVALKLLPPDLTRDPDGRRIAVQVLDEATGKYDIWLYGIDRETANRVTFEPGSEWMPFWIDNDRLAYSYTVDDKNWELRITSVDDPGQPRTIVTGPGDLEVSGVTPKGDVLLYGERRGNRIELWQVPVSGEGKPQQVLSAPFNIVNGMVSPDGKWLLYSSDESGRYEVYVRPYGRNGPRVQVTTKGGVAIWTRDGKQICGTWNDTIFTADVIVRGDRLEVSESESRFLAPRPEVLGSPSRRAHSRRVSARRSRYTERRDHELAGAAQGEEREVARFTGSRAGPRPVQSARY